MLAGCFLGAAKQFLNVPAVESETLYVIVDLLKQFGGVLCDLFVVIQKFAHNVRGLIGIVLQM